MFARFDDFDRTWSTFDLLRRRLDRVFDDFETPRRAPEPTRTPFATLKDEGGALVVTAELPGLSEKDVQLTIHQDVLTLRAERKNAAPEGYYVHRQERPSFKVARSYALPCKVDAERSTATMKNGVLTLRLEKAAEAQPRQIAVRAG